MGSQSRRLAVLLLLATLQPHVGSAQTFVGSVVGRILDSRQAPLPSANVLLRRLEQGFEQRTTSNSAGEYDFKLVPPGKFTVSAALDGLLPASVTVEVVVATPVRADLILRISPLREEVHVLGEGGVAVQTENADLGRVISPHKMSELPSLERSPYAFIALLPGATLSNDALGVGFAVNGGRTQSANYLLDGAENNEIFMSVPALDVPLDSIEEFNVQTNHYSAESGRNSSFTANVVTKSGTNNFHGSLFEYFRNSALAANTFDANAQGQPRPVFNRHQFGGTAGGPIRQRKLFYFASVEPILIRSSGWSSFYVPTPDLLAISSPGTKAIFQRFPLPENLSSTDVRVEQVCPFRVFCDAQTGAGYVTLPAFALTSALGPQDFGAGAPGNTILATGRLDWVLNQKTQTFLRYALAMGDGFAAVGQPYSRELDASSYSHNQNVSANVIRTWSSRLATETRLAYGRVDGGTHGAPDPPLAGFYIRDEAAILPAGSDSWYGPLNSYQFFQTATYSRGRHILRFGGQFVHQRQNVTFGLAGEVAQAEFPDTQGFVDGTMDFYFIALDPKGHLPGEFVDPPFGPPNFRRHYHYNEPALYLADFWKVTPRLTLTPGLRWEYFGVFHSPGAELALDANFYPGNGANYLQRIARGQMMRTVDAQGELRDRFYLPDYKDLAPRLGIAYDVFGDGRTVLRGGAGIFYDRRVGWELFRAYQNPPTYSLVVLTDVPVTPALVSDQYSAFTNSPVQLIQSATADPDLHTRSAYTASWNVTIEKEFAHTYVAGVSYLGSSGVRLYSLGNVNRVGSAGLLDPTCIIPRIASDGITILGPDYSDCSRLNPNLANVGLRTNGGHSSYHALQLKLDSRRVQKIGLEFGGNYTWSHSIDNRSVSGLSASVAETGGGYLDVLQPGLDRGASDFDVRHRVAAHFIWELPLPTHASSRFARCLLQGWEVSGILSAQTGQPFTLADTGTPGYSVERTRPRLTGQPPHSGPLTPDTVAPNSFLYLPLNQVYDPRTGLCIANATPFACEISVNGPFDGSLSRNTFRQPGLFFQDAALIKNTPLLWSETKLQFRAEFFNAFNHSNLYLNGGTTDVSVNSFSNSDGNFVPAVTASFHNNRQIVLALKLLF
jgi:Carboxypeptidase regulatory-like domain/TonB dependent receptor